MINKFNLDDRSTEKLEKITHSLEKIAKKTKKTKELTMNNNSYNAGYHRGLNSEYHDRNVQELYEEWVRETSILLVTTTNCPVTFEEGFNDGISDYIKANENNSEGLASTTAG